MTIKVPPAQQAFADTVATTFSQILTSRDGPMLKPGTRSYDRAWIRDGAMMSEALLRMGRADVARDFSDWYRAHLFDSGKVPCCVDFRGADPVPENDSQGEYIFLVSQLYRFTGDRAALERDWPAVLGAVRYMDKLRLSERTAANRAPGKRMLYGLMPPSISHEGYSAKPQYSLWDDFWALRGYRDAAEIARDARQARGGGDRRFARPVRGRPPRRDPRRARSLEDRLHPRRGQPRRFRRDLDDHRARSRKRTGAARPAMLDATFERYWREFSARAAGRARGRTIRPTRRATIGSFVRLGWRDRIDALIDFFMADRRPAAWNQWAEVVGRDPREIRFIGDMPHAWVASDFIRAALDMFAWDRRDDGALVLGAGLSAPGWPAKGRAIEGLARPMASSISRCAAMRGG